MKRREIVELIGFSLALVVYVYVIGWLITLVRLSAARLPLQSSLPMIDDKVLLATGLRNVLFMGLVFAVMCAVAYGIHTWTWEVHAQEWHAVVQLGRRRAQELHPPGPPRLKPTKPTLAALKPSPAPESERSQAGGPIRAGGRGLQCRCARGDAELGGGPDRKAARRPGRCAPVVGAARAVGNPHAGGKPGLGPSEPSARRSLDPSLTAAAPKLRSSRLCVADYLAR